MQLIVTALDCEARPLLDHYRLRASTHTNPFRIYQNTHTTLIVSGMGRVNAAAASAYLAALVGPGIHHWLNIGIAGQREYPIGSAWLAQHISSSATTHHWYPPIVFERTCPSATICTVDQPELTYPSSAIYEMEAAGFYATATRFSSGELVQCLKVISDNAEYPAARLRPNHVSQLIESALEPIHATLCTLNDLALELQHVEQFQSLPKLPWRMSVSQQHQLRELLRRYRVRFGMDAEITLSAYQNAKECLQALNQQLQHSQQSLCDSF